LPNEIISDLVEPLTIIKKGYRIVFEENALATEETTENPADEFKMRVRVITRGMNGIKYVKSLLNIFKYPFVSLQLISHKILRWCIPLFCLITFFSNIIIAFVSPFYFFLLIAQCAFYMLALIGLILEPFGVKYKLFYLPMYFFIVNAASIASMYKFLMGRNIVVWETRR